MKTQKRIYRSTVYTSLFICGLIIFWGFQVSAIEWTDAQKKVWKTVEASWEFISKGDVEALVADAGESSFMWWPDHPDPFGGGSAMKAQYNSWFGWNKPVSYEISPVAVNIVGDVSTVFYYYKYKGDKLPDTISGRILSTWIKQDGKWKFVGSMSCYCDKTPFCY
jgi:ketosteroid isomerase-like protein